MVRETLIKKFGEEYANEIDRILSTCPIPVDFDKLHYIDVLSAMEYEGDSYILSVAERAHLSLEASLTSSSNILGSTNDEILESVKALVKEAGGSEQDDQPFTYERIITSISEKGMCSVPMFIQLYPDASLEIANYVLSYNVESWVQGDEIVEFDVQDFYNTMKQLINDNMFEYHLDSLSKIINGINIKEGVHVINTYAVLLQELDEALTAIHIRDTLSNMKVKESIKDHTASLASEFNDKLQDLFYNMVLTLQALLRVLDEDNKVFKRLNRFMSKL